MAARTFSFKAKDTSILPVTENNDSSFCGKNKISVTVDWNSSVNSERIRDCRKPQKHAWIKAGSNSVGIIRKTPQAEVLQPVAHSNRLLQRLTGSLQILLLALELWALSRDKQSTLRQMVLLIYSVW